MKNLNLLPPHIAQHRQKRKLKKTMAIAQMVIFACVGLAALFLFFHERRLADYSHNLARRIAAMDSAPVYIAADLEATRAVFLQFEQFYMENFSVAFETEWVTTVLDALPSGAKLVRLVFTGEEILVEGEAAEILDAYARRQKLQEVFDYVWLGRMTLLDSGTFSYELRIRIG